MYCDLLQNFGLKLLLFENIGHKIFNNKYTINNNHHPAITFSNFI